MQGNEDLILQPVNTDWGFSEGFNVIRGLASYPGANNFEIKLDFIMRQIPEDYGWKDFEIVYNSPDNLRRVAFFDLARCLGVKEGKFGGREDYEY